MPDLDEKKLRSAVRLIMFFAAGYLGSPLTTEEIKKKIDNPSVVSIDVLGYGAAIIRGELQRV